MLHWAVPLRQGGAPLQPRYQLFAAFAAKICATAMAPGLFATLPFSPTEVTCVQDKEAAMKNGELVIDADGHILEPPDLWERYLEPQYRDRAIRLKRDDEGWEYLEIDRKPSRYCARGALTRLGSMGRQIEQMQERRELWKAGKIDRPFIALSPDEGYTR